MRSKAVCSKGLAGSLLLPLLLVSIFVAIGEVGCSKSNPASAPVGGGTSTDIPVSVERRTQILDAMSSFVDSLDGTDPAADAAQVKSFLQSMPEVARVGISSTGSVWAIFTDGRLLIRSTALENPPGLQGSVGSQKELLAGKRANHLPDGDLAVVLNSLGNEFDYSGLLSPAGGEETRVDIGTMLSDAGYFVDANHDASVVSLLTLINNVSVLHWSAHGDWGVGRDSASYYGIWTTDIRDSAGDEYLKTYLDKNEVVYFSAPNTRDGILSRPKSEWHYAVTANFVKSHMRFTTNSLVYISACWSGADQAMLDAFKTAGASVYGGWSNATSPPDAFAAARFFFDRALGTNSVDPIPNPKQRPFEYTLVWEDMYYRGLTNSTTPHGPAQLSLTQLKPDFTQLLPSLEYAPPGFDVTQTDIFLNGSFGDKTGIVTLNGSTVPFISWGSSIIQMKYPATGGILKVDVGDFQSNTIPLTEWNGTVSYTETGQGSLSKTASFSVKIIADVHRFRVVSGANIVWADKDVFLMTRYVVLGENSGGQYSCSGEYRSSQTNTLLESWDGGGSLSPIQFGTVGTGFSVFGTVDSVGGYADFILTMRAPYTKYTNTGGTTQETMSIGCSVHVSVTSGFVLPPYSSPAGSSTYSWSGSTPNYVQSAGDRR